MSDKPDLRVELVSNPQYLSGVREMVSQVSRRLGFSDLQCSQLALAVDEALANVMKHGYDRQPDGRIWLDLTPLPDNGHGVGVKIVIEDEAKQIDPLLIKGRDLEDIRPGGLGVHIIREVMDYAVYEKRGDKGMRLTMMKRQASPPKPGSQACADPGERRGAGDAHGGS